MPDKIYHPQAFLDAHEICAYLEKNRQIEFQIKVETLTRAEAIEHFKDREALLRVQNIILTEGERAIGKT